MINIGIDFGSTYTMVSTFKDDNPHIVYPEVSEYQYPTIVVYDKFKKKYYYGHIAKSKQDSDECITFKSFKMLLNSTMNPSLLKKRGYDSKNTPEFITGFFLRSILEHTLKKTGENKIERLVVGAPECWFQKENDTDALAKLKKILWDFSDLVDPKNISIVSEPTNAATFCVWNYCEKKQDFIGDILVIDYGGGTLDTAIVRVDKEKNGTKIKHLLCGGSGENKDNEVGNGGIAYQEALAKKAICESIDDMTEDQIKYDEKFYGFLHMLENRLLSMSFEIEDVFGNNSLDLDNLKNEVFDAIYYNGTKIVINYRQMYDTYMAVIEPTLKKVLDESGVDGDKDRNIHIALVGGFSHFYLVKKQVYDYFKIGSIDKRTAGMIKDENEREQAIAHGAAILADGVIRLINSAPFSIGPYARMKDGSVLLRYAINAGDELEYDKEYFVMDDNNNPMPLYSFGIDRFLTGFGKKNEMAGEALLKRNLVQKINNYKFGPYIIPGFSIDYNEILSLHIHNYDSNSRKMDEVPICTVVLGMINDIFDDYVYVDEEKVILENQPIVGFEKTKDNTEIFKSGVVLQEKYRIEEKSGQDLITDKFNAINLENGQIVMVEALSSKFINDELIVDDFYDRAKIAMTIESRYLPKIFDTWIYKGVPYIITENKLISSLANTVYNRSKKTPKEIIYIAKQIALCINGLNRGGIIKKYFSTNNILVNSKNKLIFNDFCLPYIEKNIIEEHIEEIDYAYYRAPELMCGGEYDEKCDVFSIGVIMYVLATGKFPYFGRNIAELQQKYVENNVISLAEFGVDYPKLFSSFVLKAVSVTPANRQQSINVFLKELETVEGEVGIYSNIEPELTKDEADVISSFEILKKNESTFIEILNSKPDYRLYLSSILRYRKEGSSKQDQEFTYNKNVQGKNNKPTNGHIKYFDENEKYEIGDTVGLGIYGIQKLTWKVVDKSGNKLLLLSDTCVDTVVYNNTINVTRWEDSYIRRWLNEYFLKNAFDYETRDKILITRSDSLYEQGKGDKIFIFNSLEMVTFLNDVNSRICYPSRAAISNGIKVDSKGRCSWWIRKPKSDVYASIIDEEGEKKINNRVVHQTGVGVRPAMWIKTK